MIEDEIPKKCNLKDLSFFASQISELNEDLIELWSAFLSALVGVSHEDVIDDEPERAPHSEMAEEYRKCITLDDFVSLGNKLKIDYITLENNSELATELLKKWEWVTSGSKYTS
jgi:hypothetical protein